MTANTLAWIESLFASMGTWSILKKKHIKNTSCMSPSVLVGTRRGKSWWRCELACRYDYITKNNIFPMRRTTDTLAWIGYLTTAQRCPGRDYSSRQGVLNSSCLRPPFPWPGKGGWVVWTGSRIIFAMIIYAIRVSNHTSLALGREGSHRSCVCARLSYEMEIFSKSDYTMSVRAYFRL